MLDQVSRDELAEALRECLDKHFRTYRDAGSNKRKYERILERYFNEPEESKHDPDRCIPIEVFVTVAGNSKHSSIATASHSKVEAERAMGATTTPQHTVSVHALVPLAPRNPLVKGIVLKAKA